MCRDLQFIYRRHFSGPANLCFSGKSFPDVLKSIYTLNFAHKNLLIISGTSKYRPIHPNSNLITPRIMSQIRPNCLDSLTTIVHCWPSMTTANQERLDHKLQNNDQSNSVNFNQLPTYFPTDYVNFDGTLGESGPPFSCWTSSSHVLRTHILLIRNPSTAPNKSHI
jgi:hypothetical protein